MTNFIRLFDKVLENLEVTGKKFAILITTRINQMEMNQRIIPVKESKPKIIKKIHV